MHCADWDHVFPCLASRVETWDRWISLGGRQGGAGGGSVAGTLKQREKSQMMLQLVEAVPSDALVCSIEPFEANVSVVRCECLALRGCM